MHRIDTEGSQNGRFVDEVSASRPGTIVGATWMNAIQEELVSLFVSLGGTEATLDKTKANQIADALTKKLTAIDTKLSKLLVYVNGIYDSLGDVKSFIDTEIGKQPATPSASLPADADVSISVAVSTLLAATLGADPARKLQVKLSVRDLPAKVTDATKFP